jgi:hypothetical protein
MAYRRKNLSMGVAALQHIAKTMNDYINLQNQPHVPFFVGYGNDNNAFFLFAAKSLADQNR